MCVLACPHPFPSHLYAPFLASWDLHIKLNTQIYTLKVNPQMRENTRPWPLNADRFTSCHTFHSLQQPANFICLWCWLKFHVRLCHVFTTHPPVDGSRAWFHSLATANRTHRRQASLWEDMGSSEIGSREGSPGGSSQNNVSEYINKGN